MHRESDAAAHGDAVHVGNVRFAVGSYEVIELVFKGKIVPRAGTALISMGGNFGCEGGDIATGAEGAGGGAANDEDGGELRRVVFLCKTLNWY